ncbi:hypothetical protein [Geodermatophilus sp. FMUSA9-8]|uniref:hypothetical protein n=1 Tax=Geodermatophilus sp. FMUSA9-8 TaxID=3120155 RepID=UPI00300A6E8B
MFVLVSGWVLVAVLAAAADATWISMGSALSGGGVDPEVLRSDLRELTPFQGCLIGLPAILALLSGYNTPGQPVPPGGPATPT